LNLSSYIGHGVRAADMQVIGRFAGMNDSFLGKGWSFPPQIIPRGGVAMSSEDEKIRQSIRIILSTAKGERVMRPEFGCGIHDYIFAVASPSTLTSIESEVRGALIIWEPRIEVISVEATGGGFSGETHQASINVDIRYRIRATNTEANLVYPFFLSPRG
jgi:hypothetical protein